MQLTQRLTIIGLIVTIVHLVGTFGAQHNNLIDESANIKETQIVVNPRIRSSNVSPNKLEPTLDSLTNQRRDKVKEMMKHAWSNYVTYAWGENELKPISKQGHSDGVFGEAKMGATIVDSLDTLYIMDMHEEFKQGRDWIDKNLNFTINSEISLFELNIRFLGGLLTSYALTGDVMFREKAVQIGERMLPAFNTKTGIPHALINLYTGESRNNDPSGCSVLSELGALHLEFFYLSEITGNEIFKQKVEQFRKVLKDLDKPRGLYPNYVHPETGKWGKNHMSMGALGDSFYEYLLKAWIQSGKEDTEAKIMYDEAIAAVVEHMVQKSMRGLTYLSDIRDDQIDYKMGHLACFAGGLFALGAQVNKNEVSNKYMNIGAELTKTCHKSYIQSDSKLAPEVFSFNSRSEAISGYNDPQYYILRPETYESYFILWRLTKDQKYRDWGWEAVEALEMHCRVPHGFSGVRNVYKSDPPKDDIQQTFFLAESLKYLYLLFSDDDLINLDDWVFNTEAHMLPIKGKNPLYRPAPESS